MHLTKHINKSWLISLLLIGCSTTEHAPVVDRTNTGRQTTTTQASPIPDAQSGSESQPNIHIVKKGETLYSIGLESGFDYKEIAQLNNIAPPIYAIHVGQQLTLPVRAAATTADTSGATADEDGVVITPLNTYGDSGTAVTPAETAAAASTSGMLTEPKATRQPYSAAALNAPVPAAVPQVATAAASTPAAAPAATTSTTEVQQSSTATPPAGSSNVDGIQWAWPTSGKVIAGFNDSASTKGLDIGGTTGQSVHASAAGKVIYSGSDLRGYGKLVIIKHNSTYLSVYAHNSNILVKEGQQVTQGQKIAEMGSSDTDKTKLHFEIRRQGKSVDPAKYLPKN
ncbi:lipoprotein NlpD [Methylobacillus rhizosphaerae]|uniref:Lipoprotein NlpD n=1 Tax=Methylobacillus rhizosphaerae TaxID=551994 RepID=A0A238YCG3_9PROT|nr:peptidoglycan DD-metalloendopeptidase family protein [Methylobacillus rhizosphaerae]SNR68817.1 lipoprotein NlpD [Methylobacillus rhizosphaerae]